MPYNPAETEWKYFCSTVRSPCEILYILWDSLAVLTLTCDTCHSVAAQIRLNPLTSLSESRPMVDDMVDQSRPDPICEKSPISWLVLSPLHVLCVLLLLIILLVFLFLSASLQNCTPGANPIPVYGVHVLISVWSVTRFFTWAFRVQLIANWAWCWSGSAEQLRFRM